MSLANGSSGSSRSVLWTSKPWILPAVTVRSILIIVLALMIFWLEFFFGVAQQTILNIPLMLWTGLILFIVWILSVANLLTLRASNTYILRNDSLEIKTGILTSRAFMVAPAGFANMEVIRSVSARIMNLGDIVIRTQVEGGGDKRLIMVKNPERVADQIREIMAKPIVRMDRQEPTEEKK